MPAHGHARKRYELMRDMKPEPDADHVLTTQDATICGYDLKAEIARTAWVAPVKPIPVELNRAEYHAAPYTPPAPRTWATVADQLDNVMRERLRDMFGSI